MFDVFEDKPKDPIEESVKELKNELQKFDEVESKESVVSTKVEQKSFPIADFCIKPICAIEDNFLLPTFTKDFSNSGKQAALEAFKRTPEDLELMRNFLIEVERKYGTGIALDPLTMSALLYVAGLGTRVSVARIAAKAVGG